MSRVTLRYLYDNVWEVAEPIIEGGVKVPVGFKTDLASVPRILWPLYPPFGKYIRASIIHDYLMLVKIDYAHEVFYEVMLKDGVHPWLAKIFYELVCIFS